MPLTVDDLWGTYECYCLRCSTRFVSVAPVAAESVDLWECPRCGPGGATASWQPCAGEGNSDGE